MDNASPIDQAVGAVAEELLGVHANRQDPTTASKLAANALAGPVLQTLDRQHPGLANIHLAFAFARLLSKECPPDARDDRGVPQMSLLVGPGSETPGHAELHRAASAGFGNPSSTADAKASNARFAEAIPLAQRFIQVWTLTPRAVAAFVHAQSARSPVMVDGVWGVLWQACVSVRSGQKNSAVGQQPH
ncbi:hypothetical protein [Nocardia fusca]|uniref:hypothetical protein n=1 Tax=Nocardia fusca TaxID=941183 RepID=UPI0012F4A3B8|nr:hypothetical protein [Nocardia fusca]